jgi:hypothetical protein
MGRIFSSIFEWIRRTGWHVQPRLVLCLVTIDAFERKDPLPVGAATQPKEAVLVTILTLQRRVTSRVTVHAARMHENFVRLQKGRPSAGIVTNRLIPNLSICQTG